MILKDFIPSEKLRQFVQVFRIVHLTFNKKDIVPFKAYPPRPEHCLAFYPFDTEKVHYVEKNRMIEHLPVVLYGQHTEVTQRFIGHQFLVLQVVFCPGALYCLTGLPATELTNQYLDAELVFSSQLRDVNEQLYHAHNYFTMIEIAERFVTGLIRKQKRELKPIDIVCKLMLNKENKLSLDELASEACLSTKQFERNFKERAGVNPKLYSRINRFDRAFRLKNNSPDFDWLTIALECGYQDYQHLAKEYKDFTGLSPVAFHQLENKAPERSFGLSENYYSQVINS